MTGRNPARVCVAVALVAAVAGCGGSRAPSAGGQWRANATDALTELRQDVSVTSIGASTRAEARHALRNDSDLFALLVAYSDFGGCTSMVAGVGAPPQVERRLRSACPQLERAAASFTVATSKGDPDALLRAARQAHQAEPLLVQALFAVRAG